MSRRVLTWVLAAVAVVGIAIAVPVFINATTGGKCGGPTPPPPASATGNAGSPIAASPTEEYWTEERMRNAKPMDPMPVETC